MNLKRQFRKESGGTMLNTGIRRRAVRALSSMALVIGGASGLVALTALPAAASTTITSVTVGTQSGTATTAGSTVTFPVTVATSHGGTAYHDLNLTAVSDSSALPNGVSMGTAPACQKASTSGSNTFTLNLVVPPGDNPGTFTHSLVVTTTDYSTSDGSCSGSADSTL